MDLIINLAHWFGSAVCHQWPAHSYFIAGVEVPLCARCTGMYLGALLTLIYHAWRHPRAIGVPPVWAMIAMLLFFLSWAGDGVNSFLGTIPNVIGPLYPPQNILRVLTGGLMGITLGTLVHIMFNSLVWREVRAERVLGKPRELLELLGVIGLLVIAVNSQWTLLLMPLTIACLVAILVLNSSLMAAMAANIMGRIANNWREARIPLLAGLGVALFYLDAIALFRIWLGSYLGYPI